MITVQHPGTRTLIQDHGRPGHTHLGVSPSGAADRISHTLANRLVGNPDHSPAFEVTLSGPTLLFTEPAVVAYSGPDTDLTLDGRPVPLAHTVHVQAGQTLAVGALRGGVYGYLAVRGGIPAAPTLGSASTCTLSGLGPAPLAPGATYPTAPPSAPGAAPAGETLWARTAPSLTDPTAPVRYLPGPHTHLFLAAALDRFPATAWTVSPASSRVGIRLTGIRLDAPTDSLPSLGMVAGAIQVPPSGEPIVLAADHGATGGYPVLGVVIPEDLARLAQQRPGDRAVRFTPVALADATDVARSTAEAMDRALTRLDRISA